MELDENYFNIAKERIENTQVKNILILMIQTEPQPK